MKRILGKFLSIFMIFVLTTSYVTPIFADDTGVPATTTDDATESDFDFGDVVPETGWTTTHNRQKVVNEMNSDFKHFGVQKVKLVDDYVPTEAKVGLAMMNGLSHMGNILDRSLGRFAIIFIIIAYAFWIMLETYKMMTDGAGKIKDLAVDIVKKGGIIVIWLIMLDIGPADIFMAIMAPIVSVGTYFADIILKAVTAAANVDLPDTCTAIHQYAVANTSPEMLIDANAAADLLCVPSRMSGLFQTAIAVGWKWMRAGIGTSALTFAAGAAFVVLFMFNAWKFAIMALGIIADLFLGIVMLPFTAISQTVNKTSYKGIAGDIYNGFTGLFKAESMDAQITRLINATIYFVSLSIAIGLGTALLSTTIKTNLADAVPTLETAGFTTVLLVGCLTLYLAMNVNKLVSDLGGKVNTAIGDGIQKDISNLWKSVRGSVGGWYKAYKSDH